MLELAFINMSAHISLETLISTNIWNKYMEQAEDKMVELRSVLGEQSCIDRAIDTSRKYQL